MNNATLDLIYIVIGFLFGAAMLAGVCLLAVLLFTARSLRNAVVEFNVSIVRLREALQETQKVVNVLSNPVFANAADTFTRMAAFWPTSGRLIQQLTDQVQTLTKTLFAHVPPETVSPSVAPTEQTKVMSGFFREGPTDEEQARREAEEEARKQGIETNENMVAPPPPILRVVRDAE